MTLGKIFWLLRVRVHRHSLPVATLSIHNILRSATSPRILAPSYGRSLVQSWSVGPETECNFCKEQKIFYRLMKKTVDLNLRLMKWRLVPELNLNVLSAQKCLLLGAGTLGCNVARCLMGWGINNISFVDNGRVSFSNPVRQTLFNFEHCAGGGVPKAETAAQALTHIFPSVHAQGHMLNIPMPGHIVSEKESAEFLKELAQFQKLVESHDVIFLLTDTRESRWLPTLLAAVHNKIAISVALGFDSFVVIRHGGNAKSGSDPESEPSAGDLSQKNCLKSGASISGNDLGCYFCCDILAPGDSTRDRTLDQECTVTRPGLSFMAAGNAVELLVSLLQHPESLGAPAQLSHDSERGQETVLGAVPHQIQQALREQGSSFVLKAINEPTHLENLTGLDKLHKETLDMDLEVLELSEPESL